MKLTYFIKEFTTFVAQWWALLFVVCILICGMLFAVIEWYAVLICFLIILIWTILILSVISKDYKNNFIDKL